MTPASDEGDATCPRGASAPPVHEVATNTRARQATPPAMFALSSPAVGHIPNHNQRRELATGVMD